MADEVTKVEDIVGPESLESWLTGWPASQGLDEKAARQIAVTIAHRAAMRVMPIWWEYSLSKDARKRDLTALPVLRSLFFSGVAAKNSTPEIFAAMAIATDANDVATAAAGDAIAIAKDATDAASAASATARASAAARVTVAAAIFTDASATSTVATNFAIDAARSHATALWASIRADCTAIISGIDVFATPLWVDQINPFADLWTSIKSQVPHPEWAFWTKWYGDALAGHSPNWDILEQIALIDNEVWEAGAVAVAAEIEKFELRFAVQATPNAEDIVINDDGLYQAVPRSALPARTLQDSKDRIGDVVAQIRDAQQSSNQYSALVPEADLLERTLERYADNALRLHEVCHKVVRHTVVYVADGVLPENDNLVGDVSAELMNSADDIYNFDTDVKETVEARVKLRFGRLTEDEKSNVVVLADVVADHSVEPLAEELREDAQVIAGEIEPTEDSKGNRYQLGSRLVRIVAIGGGSLVAITTALSQSEGAVKGGLYLWQIIRPLLGF